jgi:hypothetical protein
VPLDADLVAALYRMGPWARHGVTPRPLEAVSVAVEISVYGPRSLGKSRRNVAARVSAGSAGASASPTTADDAPGSRRTRCRR